MVLINTGLIRVGNLGTDFQYLVQITDPLSQTNSTADLSTATTITITITDPNGNATAYPATPLDPPGTDGIAHFITSYVTSIWIVGGLWYARAKVLFNDGTQAETQDNSFQVLQAPQVTS